MILIADLQDTIPLSVAKLKCHVGRVILSAVFALAISGCVLDDLWGSVYEADLIQQGEPDQRRFSLMVSNAPVPLFRKQGTDDRVTTYLTVAMPDGPLHKPVEIDGDRVEARFGHSTGARRCEESHVVHGTVVVRRRDYRGVIAWLDVVATCPRDGDCRFHGNYKFKPPPVARR